MTTYPPVTVGKAASPVDKEYTDMNQMICISKCNDRSLDFNFNTPRLCSM